MPARTDSVAKLTCAAPALHGMAAKVSIVWKITRPSRMSFAPSRAKRFSRGREEGALRKQLGKRPGGLEEASRVGGCWYVLQGVTRSATQIGCLGSSTFVPLSCELNAARFGSPRYIWQTQRENCFGWMACSGQQFRHSIVTQLLSERTRLYERPCNRVRRCAA
jgi:hypothetical protein